MQANIVHLWEEEVVAFDCKGHHMLDDIDRQESDREKLKRWILSLKCLSQDQISNKHEIYHIAPQLTDGAELLVLFMYDESANDYSYA